MGLLDNLFGKKKQEENMGAQKVEQVERLNLKPDFDALRDFCSMILCGHNEKVFNRCKELLENVTDDAGGIPDVLYVLSGYDVDDSDSYHNQREYQLVKAQYYFISSDAGAPCLEDFFWFVEDGIKMARELDFTIDRARFSDNDCIVEWLAELSSQLEDLYIVDFDGAGEDYHFTIMSKSECEKAMILFKKMTSHVKNYQYSSFLITSDFKG